jgi:hypothetical protein
MASNRQVAELELRKAARRYFRELLAEMFTTFNNKLQSKKQYEFDDDSLHVLVFTKREAQQLVSKLMQHVARDIEHHADKVMERGYCDGRLDARCRYLLEDLSLEGAADIEEAIVDYYKESRAKRAAEVAAEVKAWHEKQKGTAGVGGANDRG